MQGLITACGKYCPEATLNIISNPVNSTVPIAAETLKGMGVYNPKKVLGVTTLDVVRAKTFYSEKAGIPVKVRATFPTDRVYLAVCLGAKPSLWPCLLRGRRVYVFCRVACSAD